MKVGLGVTASILSAVIAWSGVTAGETLPPPICRLILHQEREDIADRELAAELASSRLEAAERIFNLVDQLWKKDAVERMVYLLAKHERDVAAIDVKRQGLLAKRQEAEVEQWANACSTPGSDETGAERRAGRDGALRRYLQADCHRIGKELATAEVDLAYYREVLASVRDLRENDVATQQDVIRAELDVETARKRVDHDGRRLRECAGPDAAGGGAGAGP